MKDRVYDPTAAGGIPAGTLIYSGEVSPPVASLRGVLAIGDDPGPQGEVTVPPDEAERITKAAMTALEDNMRGFISAPIVGDVTLIDANDRVLSVGSAVFREPGRLIPMDEDVVSRELARLVRRAREENTLLRATLVELREALPTCYCGRVATFQRYDEERCDDHTEPGCAETAWAPVARRLGW